MRRIALNLGTMLICLILVSCATSKFAQTGDTYPPYEGHVKVLREPPAGKKYVEIGWVSSSGGMVHEWTHLIAAMQKKAAAKGANAIILNVVERPDTAVATYTPEFGYFGSAGTQKSMTAVAIRILE